MSFHDLASIEGRLALVTGASGHIGQVAAETLLSLGANVILTDLHQEVDADHPGNLMHQYPERCRFVPADLTNADQLEGLVVACSEDDAKVEILVHCAALVGTSSLRGWAGPFEEQSVETWRKALDTNLTTGFSLVQRLYPALGHQSRGTVVMISSIYSFLGPDYALYEGTDLGAPAAYFASKGGLDQLARWLAVTLAPNVRVNSICPGGIWRSQPDSFVSRYQAKTPLRRMATEGDLCGAIAFLCTDLSSYVTGHRLVVDGGYSLG